MGWQPGNGHGTGDAPSPAEPVRDSRLPGFAKDGEWDTCPPSAALAAVLEALGGAEQRCPGATRDELLGLLRQWQALESWAAASKLALLRALIRDDDQPMPGGGYHGNLPDGWTKSLTHEVALALSMPAASADNLMWLAWNLQAVLPGIGALLAGGQLTLAKARAVDNALRQLGAADTAKAEAIILPDLPGKTYAQAEKLALRAAVTVDPESASRRRKDAEQHRSRVELSREDSGAAALSGRDLPTDQALAAHASICARAEQYKESGGFPKDTRMDQYRAAAYLDLINGISAETRIASGQLAGITVDDTTAGGSAADGGATGTEGTEGENPGGRDSGGRDSGGQDGGGSGGRGPFGRGLRDGDPSAHGPASAVVLPLPRLADLVIPLATLLGLAERPGEGYGLGPIDPALCRELAAAAAASPHSLLCVTVTGPDGIAIGHGCARSERRKAGRTDTASRGRPDQATDPTTARVALASLPARVNLTITTDHLAQLATQPGAGPPGARSWTFVQHGDQGPPDGYGTWTLTLPDGRSLTVQLEPVPTLDCDHRHESHAYQPNDRLRHLVQVRDGTCTFPPCSRAARESDFEHATPYHKGGRTCGCNAGARSRACHQVKQSPGWTVTQPRPGWHQWQTPAGRIYVQGPKRYPA
jgi:hypothetical protein